LASIPIADTTVLIDWLRGHLGARALVRSVTANGETLAGSVVSRLEVRSGSRPGEIATVERLFGVIRWAPVTAEIADLAGDYSRQYRRSHSSIGAMDYLVAATAAALGAELWTHNVRDFPMFPDLRAPY
jgi:hypothetical protein